MWIKQRPGWEIPEAQATAEAVFVNRRALLAGCGAVAGGLAFGERPALAQRADPTFDLYPAKPNEAYALDRAITPEKFSGDYNNFYEFGSSKSVAAAARALKTRPWTVKVDGIVEKPFEIAIDDLIRKMPLSSARYLRMETFLDKAVAPGQRQVWYPWPYVEGLTMQEAANELTFLVTGVYGKPLAHPFGAPLRLAVPWKYGFKSAKSLVRFTFTDERPKRFWEALAANEYGFWANVNPDVPHPRWSQATEKVLGTDEMRPTLLYNGYGEYVAGMYNGLDDKKERLFV